MVPQEADIIRTGRLAQLGEHLVYTQGVGSSILSPPTSARVFFALARAVRRLMLAGIAAAAALTALAPAGEGAPSYDFCVACTAPQAIYLCTVGPREPDPGARVWGSFCAERARADAGHAHCSAQAFSESCRPTRAFVFRGPSASPSQAEALVSPEPERRASAAEQIWAGTVENMRAVGTGVREGVSAMGRGAGRLWQGMVDIGGGVMRGAGCVLTFGQRC